MADIPGLMEAIVKAERERDELIELLKEVVQYADETYSYWDAGQDHKAGKRLSALAGRLKNYDDVPTLLHAAIETASVTP